MNKRTLVIAAGLLTGIFFAGLVRAEVSPPKLAELEEFRAMLTNMVSIALPQRDFDYIAARKARFHTSRQRVGEIKLPPALKDREKDFKRARKYFMKTSNRFMKIMQSEKYAQINTRLHAVDTAFALVYVALGGTPRAVNEFTAAATPFIGNKKNPPQIPPVMADVVALRQAVEKLLATRLGGNYHIVHDKFQRECKMAAHAVELMGPAIADGDSAAIKATMRGVVASSDRLSIIFTPRKK